MKVKKLIRPIYLFVFFIFISLEANAFNYESCKESFKYIERSRNDAVWLSTSFPTIVSEATLGVSQTLSSSGSCSALNATENAKINYVKENYRPLQIDIAKGKGEYLDGFIVLLNCSSKEFLKDELKRNYEKIYAEENQTDFKNTYIEISKVTALYRNECNNTYFP